MTSFDHSRDDDLVLQERCVVRASLTIRLSPILDVALVEAVYRLVIVIRHGWRQTPVLLLIR